MSKANDLQNTAIAQAANYSSQMQQFIGRLEQLQRQGSYDQSQSAPRSDAGLIRSDLSRLLATTQTAPTMQAVPTMPTISVPTPAAPDTIPSAASISIPAAPNISPRTAPAISGTSFLGERPSIVTPAAPVRPAITLPAAPAFANIVMPTITDVALPAFSFVAPTDDLTAPTGIFSFSEAAYDSALLDASKAKLLNDLLHGGYGIEVADEDALWTRERERELRAADTIMQEATRQVAARGFALPPGALLAQLQNAQQSALEKISTASREIALKRADMYVENRKFTLGQVKEMEQLMIQLHMSAMERTLNAAKATAEFGIALYNARVNKFNALMEKFKAEVSAYDSQVRGALGQLEAQKIKLQVVSTEVDVQKNQAQLYAIQVDGQKALLEMYSADVNALRGLADVERLKLDVYRADIEAYAEQMRVNTIKLQIFEAQVRGDLAQAEIFRSRVSGALAQAEVVKGQASITEANARIKTENLRAAIAAATAQADVFRAQTQGISTSNEALAHSYSARTEAIRSFSAVYDMLGRFDLAYLDSDVKLKLENVRNNIDLTKATWNVQLGAATAGTDAMGKAMQAMLNQVLGIASVASTE